MNKSWRNVVMGEGTPVSVSVTLPAKKDEKKSKTNDDLKIKIPLAAENDKKRHERLLVVYAPLVSNRVTVFLYDGAVFEGTLDSFVTEKEFALILRMATMLRPGREVIDPSIKAGITFELMNIRFDDMAELKAINSSGSSNGNGGGIGTDSGISKKKNKEVLKDRELHRWVPETSSSSTNSNSNSNSFSFTNNNNNNLNESSKWDQFATNEKLFGLKTDFDEEIYTTKLDRNSLHVRANEANAERLAKEILMSSSGGNFHLAEERGQNGNTNCDFDDDEEMLYGAVIRGIENEVVEIHEQGLPPGFNSPKKNEKEKLSGDFKFNVNAPEFVPCEDIKVTYYNQPRRNLNVNGYGYDYGNGLGSGLGYDNYGYAINYQNQHQHQHPSTVPYYYTPPLINNDNHSNTCSASSTILNNNSTESENKTKMNPDAPEFFISEVEYSEYPEYDNNNNNEYYGNNFYYDHTGTNSYN